MSTSVDGVPSRDTFGGIRPADFRAKDEALTRLEEAVEEAASAIDRDSGIPGIAMARRLRQAMHDFKRAVGGEER